MCHRSVIPGTFSFVLPSTLYLLCCMYSFFHCIITFHHFHTHLDDDHKPLFLSLDCPVMYKSTGHVTSQEWNPSLSSGICYQSSDLQSPVSQSIRNTDIQT